MRFGILALWFSLSAFGAVCPHQNLSFVAHQDDDLLFMNPDLLRAIHGGECVTTVYLTAGDAGFDATYWGGREAGIREAYALMTGVANQWNEGAGKFGGKAVHVFTLAAHSAVRVIFLRLPDGGSGKGFARYGLQSLQKLWGGELAAMTTVDGRESFTRAELAQTLFELIGAASGAELRVRTLDRTRDHGWDHSDHYHSALFATAAYDRAFPGKFPIAYRGYNISDLPQNLTADEAVVKERIFVTYARHDPELCKEPAKCVTSGLYIPWVSRQYRD